MQVILWLFIGLLVWLAPYIILSQHMRKIHQNQNHLLEKIKQLEQRTQEPTSTTTVVAPPPILTMPVDPTATVSNADQEPHQHEEVKPSVMHTQPTQQQTVQPPALLEPDERSIAVITSLWATLYGWFSGGNSIVRIGVLILLIGVGLLLRLLGETISIPIQVWLGAIALAAIGLTSVGLRLRQTRRGYALSLQGTGLAILYLTLFSTYYLYDLLPSQLTFLLLAILASVTAILSLRQDALPLAVLGFGGAFFAPILTSTGQNQVVQLFSYYLLLNIAVAWIAHQRTWKALNLMGASATLGLAALWGWQSFDPSIRWPLEALLIAHVALYVFIVVRYSQLLATPSEPRSAIPHQGAIVSIDSGLLFGVPLLAFGLQAGLLQNVPYALAVSSAALATVYLGLAYWLHQRTLALPLLREGLLALGFGFLALILPLAFDAEWTSTGWLIQGAALIWVGVRQTRVWQIRFGLGLQLISLLILAWLWLTNAGQTLWLELLIALITLLFSAALLRQPAPTDPTMTDTVAGRLSSLVWIMLSVSVAFWWLQDRWTAIETQYNWIVPNTSSQLVLDGLLLTALGLLLSTRMYWRELDWVIRGLSLIIGGVLVWVVYLDTSGQSLNRFALLSATVAWPSLQLLLSRHLAKRDTQQSQRWDQAIGLGYFLVLLSLWSVEFYPNAAAVVLLPIMLLLTLADHRVQLPDWLTLKQSQQDLYPLLAVCFGVWILAANLQASGQLGVLPYVPLLNLLDVSLLAVMFWLYRSTPSASRLQSANSVWVGQLALGGLAFWSLSGMVVRGLHQWLDTPLWPTAWQSDTVQTSLTIVWSSTALLMTVLASRRAWRALWWIGLGLLAVVIAKLLLVDLSNLSAMARVISFIGAGGVMLIIGYVAPLPPASMTSEHPTPDAD